MAATADWRGYWLVAQFRPDLFSPALVASLNTRAGVISASVFDLASGRRRVERPRRQLVNGLLCGRTGDTVRNGRT